MWIFVILMVLGAIAYAPVWWAAAPALRRYIGPRFVASFVILIFAGIAAPPNIFFLLCLAVMVFLTRGRVDAVCRFVLLGALIPSSPWALVVGGTYLIQVTTLDVLGVGLALALLVKPDRTRVGKLRGWTVEDVIAILFFVALNVAAVRLTDGFNGLMRQMISGGLTFLLPYILVRRHLRTIDEYRMVIGAFAVAAAILSVYALYEAANGWSLFVTINENLGAQNVGARNFMIRGNTLRSSTTMQGALMMGCYMSIGWIAMVCSRGLVRWRLFWILGCGLVFMGELAAQSRGSAACVALAAAILLATHRRPALAAATLAAAAGGATLLIAAARFSPKIAGFLNMDADRQAGEQYDYRQLLFRRGMEEAAKHRWTGTSLQSVVSRLDDIRQGEGIIDFVNTYLFIYLVGGLIVLIPILIALTWMFRNVIGAFRRTDSDAAVAVRSFALTAMIAILVQLAFMSFIDRMPMLLAVALASTRLFALSQKRGRVAKPGFSASQHKVLAAG